MSNIINIIDYIPLEIWLHITNISGEINLLLTCTKLFGLFEYVDINAPINECEIAIKSIIKHNEISVFKFIINNKFNFRLKYTYFGHIYPPRLMHLSCEKGNLQIVKFLHLMKNNTIQLDNFLIPAVKSKCINIVKYIFDNSGDICLEKINLALLESCRDCCLDSIKYLISKGADINANKCTGFIETIKTGNLEIIKYLVTQGANYNDYTTQIWYWTLHPKKSKVIEYMMTINTQINLDETYIFHPIIQQENIELVKYAVSKGYEFDIEKMIHFARILNRSNIIEYLESIKNDES
ncbi:ankyrin repeat-containing protein [Niemeyer virus]|uniref:Ankyrin repeat protein n=1 Tax=Acanthamoeba polyphaga mimivirus Kroon TaxID=3069720 RepID=A0A0G2Y9N8_9VIRU|nr:putative ankyrin repeat protein [Acanthamoeba polyphaga mimivirus]AKI80552.1 putative ankyrin repeat protein [Acanthamoeba polyphaga mimivirus Kroon]ALR84494.1 ankyrin repeat-containing protein [Niemeyer virus]